MERSHSFPSISVLVAARNEEANILACLQSLQALDYPGTIEVLVGNDASEDRTGALVQEYAGGHPNFYLHNINGQLGAARGKANVLAHLALAARGEVFLITDADVRVPSSWAREMIGMWQEGAGLGTGLTVVEGESIWARIQGVDWVYALALIKMATDVGLPPTAMGNNMMVSREAYRSVGGYESIPFSITEDYALFRAVKDKGWKIGQRFSKGVMAATLPCPSLPSLLQQRLRWMHGAMQAPWYLLIPLGIQASWWPICLLLGWLIHWQWGLGLWASRFLLRTSGLTFLLAKIGKHRLIPYVPLYEIYDALLMSLLPLLYYWPGEVVWKGRKYSKRVKS